MALSITGLDSNGRVTPRGTNIVIPAAGAGIGDLIYKTLEQKTVISDYMSLQKRSPYALVSDYKEKNGVVHSPVYDCKRSIYTTWQLAGMVKRLLDTSDPDAAKKTIEDIRNKVQK